MSDFNFNEHPLFQLFKSDIDNALFEYSDKRKISNLKFQLSYLNLYYRFSDYDHDNNEENVISKTITTLEAMLDLNMTVIIESDYGDIKTDLDAFLEKFKSKSNDKALSFLMNYSIHIPVTDNNKKIIDSFVDMIKTKIQNFDIELNITNRNGFLVFNHLTIPYYFILNDDFFKKDRKYLDNRMKKIEEDVNEHFKDQEVYIDISNVDDLENASKYKINFRKKRRGDIIPFSDDFLKIVDSIIEDFLKKQVKIRKKNLILKRYKDQMYVEALDFNIAKIDNKELYNGK